MKSWKQIVSLVAVAAILGGALTACGKKSDDNSTDKIGNGSVSTDGNVVVSKGSTVQGVGLDLTMQNIAVNQGGYSYGSLAQTSFQIVINGANQYMQSSGQWSQWTQIGAFWAQTASACYDQSCQTVLVSVIVTPSSTGQNYEYKEIAIKKDVRNNRIIGVREYVGAYNYLRSLDQMIREL